MQGQRWPQPSATNSPKVSAARVLFSAACSLGAFLASALPVRFFFRLVFLACLSLCGQYVSPYRPLVCCVRATALPPLPDESVKSSGGYSCGAPPLPIPNREVKPARADGTAPQSGRVGRRRLREVLPAGSPAGRTVFLYNN